MARPALAPRFYLGLALDLGPLRKFDLNAQLGREYFCPEGTNVTNGAVKRLLTFAVPLDPRPGASVEHADQLAAQINALLWGVSSTVF